VLTEFALTPAIFDEDAHDDFDEWIDQLVDLGRGMFPQVAECASIVANLGEGGWKPEVVNAIKNQKSQRSKGLCQGLLKQIDRILVTRQLCGEWPLDDIGWAREAFASHAIEPIDRIVASIETRDQIHAEFQDVRCLREVRDGGFWRAVRATASPKMVVAEQVQLLRKICVHSDWIALVNPYCCTSEQRHSLDLMMANLQAPSRLGPKLIELHGEAKQESDEEQRQQRLVANIERTALAHLAPDQTVDVYFWPRLRERVFLGGCFVSESGGALRKSPRWGVAMSHVAHETDRPDEKTHWSLLSPEDLGYWFNRHIAEGAQNKPAGHRITSAAT
jgi:hypothetical protein